MLQEEGRGLGRCRCQLILILAGVVLALGPGCGQRETTPIDAAWHQVQASPSSAQAQIKLGDAYAVQGQYNEAFIHFSRAWGIDPNSFDAAFKLASTCLQLRDPHTGLEWIDAALGINPQSAEAYELKGRLLMTKGQPHAAIPILKKAVELDSKLLIARLNLVTAYKSTGQPKAATEAGAQAVAIGPDEAPAHFAYADALEMAGQDDLAEQHYRRAIAINPDLADPKLRLALLLARHNKFLTEAYQLAKEAQKLDPGDGTAEATAGWILFLSGEERDGLKTLQSAAQAHPFNYRIWTRFAVALKRAGREEAARRAAAIAIRVGPKALAPTPPAPSE